LCPAFQGNEKIAEMERVAESNSEIKSNSSDDMRDRKRNIQTDLGKSAFRFNAYNRHQWMANVAKSIPPGADVLDAGAGTGPYRRLFSHTNYKTQDFCNTATKGKYTEMDYVCDITDIPVPNESFDVVICTEVLEHVPEPIKAIEEFSRVLRQNGRLFLSAPLGCGIHQEPYIYYGGYTPFWYQRFLGMYGFEELIITPNCGFFRHYAQESRRFMRYLFPRKMGTIAKIATFPLKLLLSLWFRKIIPFSCYFLDRLDKDKHFTVGYFVEATKKKKTD
jgi:ubiquinone/menaquinone biosynthesis C-methylase UbiE